MEWIQLEALWQQYDERLAENMRINKEILKRMIRSKPEKRLNRMRGWAIYGMVMPIPIVCIALIPNTQFRNEWGFYIGLTLLAVIIAHALVRATQQFLLIRSIDFSNQVAKTKKQLVQLEESTWKGTKRGFLLLPIGFVGVFLQIGKFPAITKIEDIGLIVFIILLTIVSTYTQIKRFKNQLNQFHTELAEIELLEKE
jgi:hypothetical protein